MQRKISQAGIQEREWHEHVNQYGYMLVPLPSPFFSSASQDSIAEADHVASTVDHDNAEGRPSVLGEQDSMAMRTTDTHHIIYTGSVGFCANFSYTCIYSLCGCFLPELLGERRSYHRQMTQVLVGV
jgi:hypothetical protein